MIFYYYLIGAVLTAVFLRGMGILRNRRIVGRKWGGRLMPIPSYGTCIAAGIVWPFFWGGVILGGLGRAIFIGLETIFGED